MKKTKLLTIVMLFLSLILSPTFSGKAAEVTLTDINNSYAKDAILELVNKGIISGKGEGKFDPTGDIKRSEFAKILVLALGLNVDNAPATATFKDVPASHWSYKYVEAAAQAKIINGFGDGTFRGGNELSRQDMAVLFVRALGVDVKGKAENLKFADAHSIAAYAADAVAFAVEMKLLNGYGDNTFNPAGNADRQAVASVATKFISKKEEIDKQKELENQPPEPKPEPKPEQKPEPKPVPQQPEPRPEPELPINHPPVVKKEIGLQQVEVTKSLSIDLTGTFEDPDNDHLTVTATSSNQEVSQASLAGSILYIRPFKVGTTTITITARDGRGGETRLVFDVSVVEGNKPPTVSREFSPQEVPTTKPLLLSLIGVFADPDNVSLSYTTSSLNSEIATATVEEGVYLRIYGHKAGETTITIKAIDNRGGEATLSLDVNVFKGNRAPVVVNSIESQEVTLPESLEINTSSIFSDPDGDDFEITALSSNVDIATASMDGDFLYVHSKAVGKTNITLTATDVNGGKTDLTFEVTVLGNQAPEIVTRFENQEIIVKRNLELSLNNVFSDPDGDNLAVTATSSDNEIATASVIEGKLFIQSNDVGSTTITVTANDGNNHEVSITFDVRVKDPLVLHLTFDGDVLDRSIYGNNGTIINPSNVVFDTGINGQAIKFNGVNAPGSVKVTNSPALKITDEATISYWVRLDSHHGRIGDGGVSSQGIHSVFVKGGEGKLNNYIYTNNGSAALTVAGNNITGRNSFTVGEWVNVVYVITRDSFKIYINGVEAGSTNPITTNIDFTAINNGDLYIGWLDSFWYPINGAVDDFRMYNKALNAFEVQGIFLGDTTN